MQKIDTSNFQNSTAVQPNIHGGPMSHSTSIIDHELDQVILDLGKEIFTKSESVKAKTFFSKDYWYSRIMDWSMKNEAFKVQMFRFVDVLPTLNTSQEVSKHLKEYFSDLKGEKNTDFTSFFSAGLGIGSLAPGLLAKAIKKNIEQMAKMFITGSTPEEAIKTLSQNRKNSLGFTVDLLGEATLSQKEALDYQKRYLELIQALHTQSKSWSQNPLIDTDSMGDLPAVNVSIKLTSLYSQIKETAWDTSIQELIKRLSPILDLAIKTNTFINIDMESFHHKNLTLDVFKKILSDDRYKDYPHWGIVIQAYLRDSYSDINDLLSFTKDRALPITVRLVKGAYWDYESILSNQHGWPNPVYTIKQESDANYERCAELILKNYPKIKLAVGSHNVRSIAASICMAEKLGLPKNALEIQMLYGMAEPIKLALLNMGYRVREYATVGQLIPGMAYLVRRLLENTSNQSFLKSKFADNVNVDLLLKNPNTNLITSQGDYVPHPGFENEPLLDFTLPAHRHQYAKALAQVKTKTSDPCPLIINGQAVKTDRTLKSINPCDKKSLGEFYIGSTKEADEALASAIDNKTSWSQTPPEKRCEVINKLADILKKDRFELAALMTLESGKAWSEADGDVTEAIDFCRYYAFQMHKLAAPQKTGHVMGENSFYQYQAKGVSLVVAPWNFPLAILTGMTVASLVTGNTVIMKPAEQSTLIAYELMKRLIQAGVPNGVVNFLPGIGNEIGAYLTSKKEIDIIAFTGSKNVGLEIIKKAGTILPGQQNIKKCIIEMGGKNATIIDNDADLDEAVSQVLYSAFAFQGQKCSACSRVIVLKEAYDNFVERIIEAAKSLKVLPSEHPHSFVGAVVDEVSFTRIQAIIEKSKQLSTLAFQGSAPEQGYFIPPTIFTDVDPYSELAQSEIFGPVLAIIKVTDINEAIKVSNSTEYALTGGIFSRSPGNIELVKQQLEVGNLYINRSITGAVVDRHPFGGYKMSGVGSKAGGPDYLLQFVNPKVITENTMRRGFAPLDES